MIVVATSAPNKWKIGAEIIKIYQNTKFSHVLVIKDGVVYQASRGEVHTVPFATWRLENTMIDIYLIPDIAIDMDYVKSQVGIKYGYLQLFRIGIKYFTGIVLKKNNGDSRLICSEYVGRALRIEWVNDYTSPMEINNYLKRFERVKDI